MVKKLKWNLILMSLLYVGLGIFLVMKPGTALNIVCYALGGVVLACAAVQKQNRKGKRTRRRKATMNHSRKIKKKDKN